MTIHPATLRRPTIRTTRTVMASFEDWERDDDDDNGYVDDVHGFDFTDAPAAAASATRSIATPIPRTIRDTARTSPASSRPDGASFGVAPFVRVMPVRRRFTTAFGGVLETDDAAAAIVYAVDNGAKSSTCLGATARSRC
jgi:hypothetical protein